MRPERNLLESSGDSRHLEPKAMDALVLLADRAGEVVSKDELIDEVWEGRIISEGTLTNTIAELRAALGDDARNPRYIETIPKRGYRLLCPVEELAACAEPAAAEPEIPRRLWIAPAAVLAIALAATVAVVLSVPVTAARPQAGAGGSVRQPDRRPCPRPAGDPRTGPDRRPALRDRASRSRARPATTPRSSSLDEICRLARTHGAGLALTGALYLHDGELEVQSQLVDVAEGAVLYAEPGVTGPKEQATATIEAAFQRILGALATHLYAHAHSTLLSRPPVFEAYREFLAASETWFRDLPSAVEQLQKAVEIDPDFTSAQLRLAMALRLARRAEEGRAILDHLDARRANLTEFERLWLDAFLADFEGRWEDALAALHSVHKLSPTDWTGLYLIAIRELMLNRPRRAIADLDQLHALRAARLRDASPAVRRFLSRARRGVAHRGRPHPRARSRPRRPRERFRPT